MNTPFSAAIHFTALDSAGVITVLNLDVSQPDALLCSDIEQCVNYLVEQQEAQEVRAELHCEQADPNQHRWLFYKGGNSARTNAGAKALTTMVFAAHERSLTVA